MPIKQDIQQLEVDGFVVLYELDLSQIGGIRMYFHGYPQQGAIKWKGKKYEPWAIEAKGFAKVGEGQQPSPTLTVGNIGQMPNGEPYIGVISQLCLEMNDLVGAMLVRRQTLAKYLDDGAEPDPSQELPIEVWQVEQKTEESKEAISFSLKTQLDFNQMKLPRRVITASFFNKDYKPTRPPEAPIYIE